MKSDNKMITVDKKRIEENRIDNTISEKQVFAKHKNNIELLVDYFFDLKGWSEQPKEFYAENGISYGRFCKEAKQLLELCDGDLEKAKERLDKTAAKGYDEWIIGTSIKQFLEV